jgi:hypothetical protein
VSVAEETNASWRRHCKERSDEAIPTSAETLAYEAPASLSKHMFRKSQDFSQMAAKRSYEAAGMIDQSSISAGRGFHDHDRSRPVANRRRYGLRPILE